MTRPRLLDLFAGAGGCSVGYARAGFDVVGVDILDHPDYPFPLVVADAMDVLADREFLGGFDVIHASPPCQAFSAMRVMANARTHADLLTPTRERLLDWGGPFVIENVPQAPMSAYPETLFGGLSGVVLCGSMFGLADQSHELRRHRQFESNRPIVQLPCRHDPHRTVIGFYGDHARGRTRVNGHHARGTDITGHAEKMALVRDLMGIDWMKWDDATQAIPPAYAEYIGRELLDQLVEIDKLDSLDTRRVSDGVQVGSPVAGNQLDPQARQVAADAGLYGGEILGGLPSGNKREGGHTETVSAGQGDVNSRPKLPGAAA